MSEPFIGEIRMFGGNYAPNGWALCNGQILDVSSNEPLSSLLGTTYGGDGSTTFGLPDLRGRLPIHQGTGPGLSPRGLGSKAGAENETVTSNQLPSHGHPFQATAAAANSADPAGQAPATAQADVYGEATTPIAMSSSAITATGGGQSHTNLQPFLCVSFIIALYGIHPSPH